MMRGTNFPCNLVIFWTAILGKGRDQKNGGGGGRNADMLQYTAY